MKIFLGGVLEDVEVVRPVFRPKSEAYIVEARIAVLTPAGSLSAFWRDPSWTPPPADAPERRIPIVAEDEVGGFRCSTCPHNVGNG